MKMTTRTKAAAAVLILAMALSLTACGHEHVWYAPTCTAPKTCSECGETEGAPLGHVWFVATCAAPQTCSVCGETEGEALPHTWEEPTCTTPKTCSVCGETEGEAPGHDWQEANFQSPQTCTVCGVTEGDVLTPEFEKYSIELMSHEGEHDLAFAASDHDGDYVNTISMLDYQVFESDETHPAKDGYEYRTAVIDLKVSEDTYRIVGYGWFSADYYDETTITNRESDEASDDPVTSNGTVYINGEEYEYWCDITNEVSAWAVDPEIGKQFIHATLTVVAQVPVGFDGVVACVYDYALLDGATNADGEFSPAELFSNNPGHYAAFRLD